MRGDLGGIIHRDNSAGYWFCIKGFNYNELFQICRDYETENVHHKQHFSLILSKSYKRYFFSLCCLQSRKGQSEE